MRRFSGYGPSLIVLFTAALVLFVGPRAVQQLTYEQTKTQIIQARLNLESTDVLAKINQAYRDIGTIVEPSVVHVSAQYVDSQMLSGERGISTGSGWIYDDLGHIVTNNHVIQNAERIDVQLYDGRVREATLVGADPSTDIAVIKISPERIHPAVIADLSEPVKQGDLVFAFGSPFDFRFSMSSGVVSGKDRSVNVIRDANGRRLGYENFIQVDAAINPGNSGGPLTDFRGRVIGMNTAIATGRGNSLEQGQFAGIGLAIPMEMIQPAVTQLIKNGYVEKGFLGVRVPTGQEANDVFLHRLGFTGKGVLIMGVTENEAAAEAGVLPGDIVTHVSDKPVATIAQLQSYISSILPGETAKLNVWRINRKSMSDRSVNGEVPGVGLGGGGVGAGGVSGGESLVIPVLVKRLDTLLAVGELPPDQDLTAIPGIGIAKMSTNTPETARRFNVPYYPGVMLEALVPDATFSAAVKAGTTIISVNDRPVSTVEEFVQSLRCDGCDLLRLGVPATAYDATGRAIVLTLRVQ